MLLPVKPICQKKRIRRDGTCLIFIQYCYSGTKRTLLDTGIAIPPNFWNRKLLRITGDLPVEYGTPVELNKQIAVLIRIAEDIIAYAIKMKSPDTLTFVKNTFHPRFDIGTLEESRKQAADKDKKENLDLFFQIDDYIKCKRTKVSASTISIYGIMKEHLTAFQVYREMPVTFDSLDYNFYETFVDFLTHEFVQKRRKKLTKGLKLASIGKTIKQLRIFIRDRTRRKIIQPLDLSDFKILDEVADAVYLTWEEIKEIFQVDLADYPHLVKYRDLLVLGCLTGLRFSDFSQIKPEDIRQEMLYKKQDKSDHWVVIPLREMAVEILISRFNGEIPAVSNAEFNRHIKEVVRLAGICEKIKFSYKKGNKDMVDIRPKYAWVTSHTCRRSFCTNEFLAGTPVELIMKISGHKSLRDFYKYIKITPEEAGRKIREIWQQRGDMRIFEIPKLKVV